MPLLSPLRLSLLLTLNLVGFALLVVWAVPREHVRSRILEEIGRYSYSIYLWHTVVVAVWTNQRKPSWAGFIGSVITSIAIGIAMALLVEVPVLSLRDRFFPAGTRKPPLRADSVRAKISRAEASV